MNEEQLSDLLNKFYRGDCTEEEMTALNEWYQTANLNDRHMLLPESSRNEVTENMYSDFLRKIKGNTNVRRRKLNPKRRIYAISSVAAALLLFACAGWYIYLHRSFHNNITETVAVHDVPPGQNGAVLTLADGSKITLDSSRNKQIIQQGNINVTNTAGQLTYAGNKSNALQTQLNTLTTPRARQYKVILPDGTKVWLNAESSITYPVAFTGNTREVSVTGETYFEVIHNPSQPFKVNVNGQTIEDIGTHFDINAYKDEPVVKSTLSEGSIRITKGAKNVILKPGQQASVNNLSTDIKISEVNTDNITAWTKGFLFMSNNNVRELMNSISRWYNVDVRYEGEIPTGNFGGLLNSNTNLSDILSALDAGGIHTKFDGKTIIVSAH